MPLRRIHPPRASSYLLLVAGILAACRFVGAGTSAVFEAAAPASPAVLAACDVESQVAAMHPDHIPDWGTLDLPACYELTLDLQPDEATYAGGARVTFANLTGSVLNDLVFRTYPNSVLIYGGELIVTAARVDGATVKPEIFLPDNTGVRVPLAPPLEPGQTAVVDLEFVGRPPVDFGDLPRVYGIFNYAAAARVLTLANWYPLLAVWQQGAWRVDPVDGVGDAVVSEAALYRVSVQAPEAWQLATTGTAVASQTEDGVRQQTFVSGPVREFIVLASPTFAVDAAEVDGVQVRHWGLPGGEARWPDALRATVDSVALFNEKFGPYPYRELDVVAAPLQNASGVEYPGLFLLGDSLYRAGNQQPFVLGIVVAHEAGHQWWYGVVGSDVLTHPWQDEALTTFSSLIYQEVRQPQYHAGTRRFYEQQVASLESAGPDADVAQPVAAFVDRREQYSPIVYLKGALFFAALREQLGDDKFFAALRSYYAANRYKLAQPADLLSAFEAQCRCDLAETFAAWGVE